MLRRLVCAFTLLAGLSACNGCQKSAVVVVDAGATPAGLSAEESAKVLARVGTKTITLGEFAATLERMDSFDRLRYQSAERRKELLEEMINIEVLAQEAVEKGYDKDPVTQEETRIVLRDAYLAEIRKNAPKPEEIPEADARAYFEAHRADYKDPERRRVSVIVLRDESSATAVQKLAKSTTTANEWGELVRAKSVDPSAHANLPLDLMGDIGIVSPPNDSRGENDRVPQPVRESVFRVKNVGEVADAPVRAGDKWYVVKYVGKTDAHDRTFQEAERTIRVKLAQERLRAKEEEALADLKKRFPVRVNESALEQVRVNLGDAGLEAGSH